MSAYFVFHGDDFVASTSDVLTAMDVMRERGFGARVEKDDGTLLAKMGVSRRESSDVSPTAPFVRYGR